MTSVEPPPPYMYDEIERINFLFPAFQPNLSFPRLYVDAIYVFTHRTLIISHFHLPYGNEIFLRKYNFFPPPPPFP